MTFVIKLFITFFFIFTAIGFLPRHCGNGWKYFEKTKSCYKLSYDAPWREAEENCTSYSGHLASIHSSEENNFVAQLVFNDLERDTENDKFIWIGGVSLTLIPGREDQILWLDNTPYDYTAQNFMYEINPEKDMACLKLRTDKRDSWELGDCRNEIFAFVCKSKKKN